jgi:hypothetical protein
VPSGGRTIQEICEQIAYSERHARLSKARRIELIGELDALDGHHSRGFGSTADWLAFECKMHPRTARDHVRVARRLRQWGNVADAFGEGRLSYCQVRALTRAPEAEDEASLLRVALISSAREIENHVRQLRSAASGDLDIAERGRAKRFVRTIWAQDGSLKFFGRIPAEVGAAVLEAIETKAAQIHGEDGDPCRPDGWTRAPIGVRRADALAELVTGGGVETTVVLHADLEALACAAKGDQPRAGDILHLRDGPAIPSETARRLCCDSKITVHGLNRGRSTRTITDAQCRALEARDGRKCAFPGCERTHGLEGHHLIPWAKGGQSNLDELILLCPYHHHTCHEGGFTIWRHKNGTITVKDPKGRPLYEIPPRASPWLIAA